MELKNRISPTNCQMMKVKAYEVTVKNAALTNICSTRRDEARSSKPELQEEEINTQAKGEKM